MSDLKKLCRRGVKELSWTTEPFSTSWNGYMWSGATDGFGMIVVKVQGNDYLLTDKVAKILSTAMEYTNINQVSLSDLKRFLGEPVWDCERCDEPTTCTECKGDSDMRCDSCGQEIVCEKCHGSGKGRCSVCNDRGYIGKGDAHRSGVVHGVAVNMNLLARYLSGVDGETVQVRTGKKLDPLLINGTGWMVLLMPLDRVLADGPVYPVKENP